MDIISIAMLKKLFDRYLTLMLIPDKDVRVKNAKISYGTIGIILLFVLIILTTVIYIIFDYQSEVVKKDRYERLISENVILKKKFRNLKNNTNRNQKVMYQVLNSIDNLLVMNNLPPTSDAIKEMGIGGTQNDWNQQENYLLEPELKKEIKDISTMITKTESRIEFAKKMIKKIKNSDEIDNRMWSNVPTKWPVYGWITSGFGPRLSPITGDREHHNGIDIAQSVGQEVRAPGNGKVVYAGIRPLWGKNVIIKHSYGITTRYAHMDSINVHLGEKVKKGQIIGSVGATGNSVGPHLHYEVRVYGTPVNPMKYILSKK